MEVIDGAGEEITTLKRKSTRCKADDGSGPSLKRKLTSRKTKLAAAADEPMGLEPIVDEVQSPTVGNELDRIASGRATLALEETETELPQTIPDTEPQQQLRLLSDAERTELDCKYGHRGTPVALDVLIGKVANRQTIALENLFFHTARVLSFQVGDKKFFIALIQDSQGNSNDRTHVAISCDKGNAQIFLDSPEDLAIFSPELSKFSIDSYPAPVQEMLLNSLLSPLLDRLSTLLATKVSMRLAEIPQGSSQFSFSARVYDGNPHEGKEAGLLLSARVAMDLPLAEEFGKSIQQVPLAVPHTFPISFRCENRVAETNISKEDLASLRLGDVIFLDNTASIEAKQMQLLGLNPYMLACIGDSGKLTITGIRKPAA
jgi:hypothetical protein